MIAAALVFLQVGSVSGDFQFDATALPVETVYRYRKSNIDGTSASNVLLYVASRDRIESLKWSGDEGAASWIVADMDWERLSVRSIRNWRLRPDSEPELRGRLELVPESSTYYYEFGPNRGEAAVRGFPWHSYDFDFSSLNVTLRFLRDPTAGFTFTVADAIPAGETWIFGEVGPVSADYLGEELRHGDRCYRYAVDGAGLAHQGGYIWVSKEGGHIVDMEIALPDEDKYQDGKLRLLGVEHMTAGEWQATVETAWRGVD